MKFCFTIISLLIGVSSFSQDSKDSISIKEIINCYEKRTLRESQTFILAKKFYLIDSSYEGNNSFTLTYKKGVGNSFGIHVTKQKVDMVIYFVNTKEIYDSLKSELKNAGFKTDKPHQNENEGLVEEQVFLKDKTMVVASILKNKSNSLQYNFLVSESF